VKDIRRVRLTYANVVASLALFAALGGSSYAAISVTGAQVRDNSLSGRDVRNASLTGRDVRDRSLLAQDFKPGQLPAGPEGSQGDTGAPGPKGDTGAPGAKGDQGEPGIGYLAGQLAAPLAPNAGGSLQPVTLERPSRLLVHGVLEASSFTCAAAAPASCKTQIVPVVDGKAQATSVATLIIAPGQTKSFAPATQLLAVTDEVPAGEHQVGIGLTGMGQFNGQSASFGYKQIFRVG
jgi:hypothetical protein